MEGKNQREVLSEEDVLKVVQKIDKNAKLNQYTVKPFSDEPMGFLGELYSLKLNINDGKDFSFFVKSMPKSVPAHLKYAQECRAFYKETELYKTLFEDMREAQNKLTPDTRWAPDFYYAKGCDALVLEDLSILGYKLYPERKALDEKHTLEAIKSMARLHAGNFIFEDKFIKNQIKTRSPHYNGENKEATLGEIYEHLTFETEIVDTPGHGGYMLYEAAFLSELVLLEYLTGYTPEEMRIIKEKLIPEMRKLLQMVKPSTKYKNIFIHGDLWSNNIMFRYNKDGEVDHALVVDYQLARYAPPAHEIMMFLHLTLSKEYRQENENRLIDFYYKIFSEELEQYGLSSDTLLPYDVFKESCDYYRHFATLTAAAYVQFILLPAEVASRYLSSVELFNKFFFHDRSDAFRESFLFDSDNRKRMLDTLTEVIDKYILKR